MATRMPMMTMTMRSSMMVKAELDCLEFVMVMFILYMLRKDNSTRRKESKTFA